MPMPKNKYRKGYIIFGLDELADRLNKGEWIYLRDKVVHPSFISNMTLKTIMGLLERPELAEAIDQKKEYYAKWREVEQNANTK